jgi:hypothetical protein
MTARLRREENQLLRPLRILRALCVKACSFY